MCSGSKIDLVHLRFRTLRLSDPIMSALLSSWSGWWSGKASEGEKEDGEKEDGEKEEGEKEEGGEKKEGGSTTESWSAGIGSKKLLGRL